MATVAQIKQMAENAHTFCSGAVYYEIDYCDEEYFSVADGRGNDIEWRFEDVNLETDSFWILRKMEVRS